MIETKEKIEIPTKSSGKRWSKTEWEFCKENLKNCDTLLEVAEKHAEGGFKRTADAISTKVDKSRHFEIILIKYCPTRDFKEFETKALLTYIVDNQLTYDDVINSELQLAHIAIFFMRSSINIKEEIEENKLLLQKMTEEKQKKLKNEGLRTAPEGIVTKSQKTNPFYHPSETQSIPCQPIENNQSLIGKQKHIPFPSNTTSEMKSYKHDCQSDLLRNFILSINPKLNDNIEDLDILCSSIISGKSLSNKVYYKDKISISIINME